MRARKLGNVSFSIPLSVVLNGTRDYVQGSQIVSRAIEEMLRRDARDLLSVSFHNITDHLVTLQDAPDASAENTLGEVTVRAGDGSKTRVYLTAQPQVAPRETRPERVKYEKVTQSGPLDAVFDVQNVTCLEDFFDALVQSVKKLHEALAEDVTDVWFTGLRGTTFPLQPEIAGAAGRLTVDFKRIMKSGDRWQTLMGFSFADQAGDVVLAGGLTFAFKSGTKPDVD